MLSILLWIIIIIFCVLVLQSLGLGRPIGYAIMAVFLILIYGVSWGKKNPLEKGGGDYDEDR